MVRQRTIKTVNASFIEDVDTILTLLRKHMCYLNVGAPHYKAIADLNSHVVETARLLHGPNLPWAQSSTGPAKADGCYFPKLDK